MQHDESNEIGVFTSKEELTRWKLLMEALRRFINELSIRWCTRYWRSTVHDDIARVMKAKEKKMNLVTDGETIHVNVRLQGRT